MRNPGNHAHAAAWVMVDATRTKKEAAQLFGVTVSEIGVALRRAEGARAFTRQMGALVQQARNILREDETLKPSELGKRIGVAAGCARIIMIEVQFEELRERYSVM